MVSTVGAIVLPTAVPVVSSIASTDHLMLLTNPSGTPLSGRGAVSLLSTALGLGSAATKNIGTTAGTVAAGDDSRFGGGGGAVSVPATYFVTTADITGTADAVRSNIQTILNTYAGVPTRIILPAGVITINEVVHPNNGSGGFGRCGLALRSKNILVFSPGTTLKLTTATTLTAESRVITNWQMNAGGTYDTDMAVEGYDSRSCLIDGSGGSVSSGSVKLHGIQLWRAIRSRVERMRVIDCNGYNTGAGENFLVDFIRCQTVRCTDCVSERTAGTTATLFSASFCDDMKWTRCYGAGSTNGHGFALYSCSRSGYTDCLAEMNGSVGFNLEHCWDTTYNGCIAGGETTREVDSSTPAFTTGSDRGNNVGFNCNTTSGGGNTVYIGCHASFNTTGFTILGGHHGTAAAGTTASTIVDTVGMFFPTDIGRIVQVAGGVAVRITGYTSATTVTTSAAHGGTTGGLIEVWGGSVRVDDTTVNGSTTGCQFNNGGGAGDKRNDIRMTRFGSSCDFYNNTNDFVDVGNGSSVSLTTFTPGFRIPDTLSSNWVTATPFTNPFPFDVLLVGVGATAVTNIASRTAPTVMNSSGVQSGAMVIGPGVTFTMTAPTQARFIVV